MCMLASLRVAVAEKGSRFRRIKEIEDGCTQATYLWAHLYIVQYAEDRNITAFCAHKIYLNIELEGLALILI